MPNTACTTERTRSRTKRVWEPDERVTLSQAARIAPGGVSPNCIWRWCRRGVLSRMGERVRLEHIITIPVDTIMTVDWSGLGETEAPNFELMSLSVDGALVGSANAPGGGQGCAAMGPVVSNPPPPQQVALTIGRHTLMITATTNDALHHFGAFYQFGLSFVAVV